MNRLLRCSTVVAIASLVGFAGSASAASKSTMVDDFSTYAQGVWLPGSAISTSEITFPDQQCGGQIGCHGWFIGGDVSDPGLHGGEYLGLISGTLAYPASALSIHAKAGYQFKAAYTLSAFDARGQLVGTVTEVRQADEGLPDYDGPGYFPITLANLRGPACSFLISSKWLASSYAPNNSAEYGISDVSLRVQSGGQRCHEAAPPTSQPTTPLPGNAGPTERSVTIDFSGLGGGTTMLFDRFETKDLLFPQQQCGGGAGCHEWLTRYVQGRIALEGGEYIGPISGSFGWPVSSLSVEVSTWVQYKGAYTLTAYDARNWVVGQTTVISVQDQGLPDFSGWGYVSISLPKLHGSACSFQVQSKYLASSYDGPMASVFGMASLSFDERTTGSSIRRPSFG